MDKRVEKMELVLFAAFVLVLMLLIICLCCTIISGKFTMKEEERETEIGVVAAEPAMDPVEMTCDYSLEVLNEAKPENEFHMYRVNGQNLEHCYQSHLWNCLQQYGIEWMYPVLICEIYQESRFNTSAMNSNGLDYGLCQMRVTYWEEHARSAGVGGASIWDPYAQITTMAYLTYIHLQQTDYNEKEAVKLYFNSGSEELNNQYWEDVSQWFGTLERL